jgi:hypothetical protein
VLITIEAAGGGVDHSDAPYLACQLSVLRLVQTLTSKMRCDRTLDGRCKAIRGHWFILVPAVGPYVQQTCARGAILQCTVELVEGGYKRVGRGGKASKSLLGD